MNKKSRKYHHSQNKNISCRQIRNQKNSTKSDKNKVITQIKFATKVIAELITVFSSVATCITVLEMRNERNQAYKPYFIIEEGSYSEEFEKPAYNVRDTNNLVQALLLDADDFLPMAITIDNIGSGTATNIVVDYSCKEYEDYWAIVCEYYDDDDIKITENELLVTYYLSAFEKVFNYKHYMETSDLNVNKPYVFSGESFKIPIPEEYRRLLYTIAYCTNGDYMELPKIDIDVYFEDLQGIKYHKAFKLSFAVYVNTNIKEKSNYVECVIEQFE